MGKYLILSRTVLSTSIIYRLNLFLGIASTIIAVFALRQVWDSLLSGNPIQGTSISSMLTYVTIAMLLQAFYGSSIIGDVSHAVHSGNIAIDFLRPWDYQLSIFFRLIGSTISSLLTIIIPIIIITIFIFPINVPSSLITWLTFIISVLLGIIIHFSLQFFIGMLAFVFVEVWGFEIVLGLMVSLFAGKLVPLWFFPSFLKDIVDVLPFRGMYDIPVSIFIGKVSTESYFELLAFQLAWGVALFLLTRFMLKYFQRVLIVAGG